MAIQPTSSPALQFITAQQSVARGESGGKAGTSSQIAQSQAVAQSQPVTEAARAQASSEDAANRAASSAANTEALREAIDRAQSAIAPKARDITFSLNEKTNSVVVKIIDRESEEVIRQIPSEEFLRIAETLNSQIENIRAGLLVEQKA